MEEDFFTQIGSLNAKIDNARCEAELRNEFQTVFAALCRADAAADIPMQEKYFAVLSLLRRFNCRHFCADAPAPKKAIDLNLLCRTAVFCSDILVSPTGKRIFFSGNVQDAAVLCNARQLQWALLCMLSFAAANTQQRYIGVRLTRTDAFFLLSVEWYGTAEPDDETKLLLQAVARQHGGSVLRVYSTGTDISPIARLGLSVRAHAATPAIQNTSISDLLDDRLSPLYAAFCRFV